MTVVRWGALIVLCSLLNIAWAGPPISVASLDDPIDLTPELMLLEDPEGQLTIDELASPNSGLAFHPPTESSANYGFTDSTWWVRVDLVNPGATDRSVILRQDYPLIDRLDFWQQDSAGKWMVVETGDRRPFHARPIEHRDFLFETLVQAGQEKHLYLRFASGGSMNISLSLYAPEHLVPGLALENLALGVYFGGFLVLVVYNLIIFAAVRDRAFAYYLLYLISYGLYFAGHNGLSFQYLWPEHPNLGNQSLLILLGLTLIWGMQFTRLVLDTATDFPGLNRVARVFQWCVLAGLILVPFLAYATVIVPASIMALFGTVLILVIGSYSLISGNPTARYFMLAWSALLLGVIVYMLKTFGWLPHNVITQNGQQIGSLIEMVLLSVALATRVKSFKRQSLTDPLTQISNRRYFDDMLTREFDRAVRYRQPLSLMMIDVDHFKRFNDLHGHGKGDELLQAVAGALRTEARRLDHACRYAGDEFAMILPGTSANGARHLAERVREHVYASEISGEMVSLSVGLASLMPAKFSDARAFFEAADKALMAAKQRGRDRVISFIPEDILRPG